MGLQDILRRLKESQSEREKRELLETCSIDELRYIAKEKGIYTPDLRTRDQLINAILKEGVGTKFIRTKIDEAIIRPSNSNVRNVIEDWEPPNFRDPNENSYTDNLRQLLERKFGRDLVKTTGRGRANPDIIVADTIPIELKYNLSGTSERRYLFSEINDCKKEYAGTVFVVHCVDTDIHDSWIEIKNEFRDDGRIVIIEKSV